MATIATLNTELDKAVSQVIKDSERLHIVVNGDANSEATADDGSKLPSVRKALIDNLYFKTPLINWANGALVREFNQLYLYTDEHNVSSWWFAPGATQSRPVTMRESPMGDKNFRVVLFSDDGSLYAPITSPDFRGNPRAPTAPRGDSSTTIASTEFVQKELDNAVNNPTTGEIAVNTLTVSGAASLGSAEVKGNVTVDGAAISASSATAKVKSIVFTSADSQLTVDPSVTVPTGKNRTTVTVTSVSTDSVSSASITAGSATLGSSAATGVSNTLLGQTVADAVQIKGKAGVANSLEVAGLTVLDRLKVTSGIEGITVSVDGKDIHPASVSTTASLSVGTNAAIQGTLAVTGKTTVNDLNILGTVTGLSSTVDGKDIRPASVRTTAGTTVGGDLVVSGKSTLTGDATANNLTVNGTLVANVDLSGKDITVRNLSVTGDTQLSTLAASGDILTQGRVTANAVTIAQTADVATVLADRVALRPSTATNIVGGVWTPDGASNVYNVPLTSNITVNAPTGLLASGKSASIFMYFEQDSVGGHTVTFSSDYIKIGGSEISTLPGAVNIVQLIYRGTGNVIDMIVTARP